MTAPSITGAVLAGGEGRRMGGVDKGLVTMQGKPLVAWVLEALQPQVDTLLVNANRSLAQYRQLGWPVASDNGDGYQGPLAGVQTVLAAAQTEWVLTAPCDAPHVPCDLAARLYNALCRETANIAVVRTGDRRHAVHALMRRDLLPSLTAALNAGQRTLARWQDAQHCIEVPCDDIADAFANINTIEQRDQMERISS